MRILVLINNAPSYKRFYSQISQKLGIKGYEVFFAITSRRLRVSDPDDYIDNSPNSFYFDEYYSLNKDVIASNAIQSTWGDLFYSDFDRFLTHGYNLNKSSEYWKSIASSLTEFFEQIITQQSIDFILYENVSNSFAYAAYHAAIKNNCIYLGLMGSRLPNRYEIQSSIYDESEAIKCLAESLQMTPSEISWADQYLKDLTNIQPDYMKNNALNRPNSLLNLLHPSKVNTVLKQVRLALDKNADSDYQSTHPVNTLIYSYKNNLKKFWNEKQSSRYLIEEKDIDDLIELDESNFYVYPTHYHPESSTSVLAPSYTNEFNNILNIHNNLPIGTYLYVKDHISARGIQSKQFYHKLSALPGVRIVHYNYNSKKLVMKSKGVITVTSTVGYEAALLGKPVYLLGRVFYERFPNVFMIDGFKNLRLVLSQHFTPASSEYLYRYLIAYKRYTYEGKLLINTTEKWSDEYFSGIANNILERYNEIKQ